MKKCSLCGIDKSKEMFGKSSSTKDGLKSRCRECRSIETKEYRKKYREKVLTKKKEWYQDTKLKKEARTKKALDEKTRVCTQCKIEKDILEFRKRTNGGFYSKCKECEYKNNKMYKLNNPKIINDLKVISENKRRKKAKTLESTYTRHEWNDCKAYFNNKCAYCGKEMKNLTQDHFIPLSKDGDYTKHNIVPSCRSCNSSKHNSDPFVWFENNNISLEYINKIEEYFRSL